MARRVLGAEAFGELIRGRELGDRIEERMRFYSWMGAVHAILHGISERVDAEVQAGLAGLSERLARPF